MCTTFVLLQAAHMSAGCDYVPTVCELYRMVQPAQMLARCLGGERAASSVDVMRKQSVAITLTCVAFTDIRWEVDSWTILLQVRCSYNMAIWQYDNFLSYLPVLH